MNPQDYRPLGLAEWGLELYKKQDCTSPISSENCSVSLRGFITFTFTSSVSDCDTKSSHTLSSDFSFAIAQLEDDLHFEVCCYLRDKWLVSSCTASLETIVYQTWRSWSLPSADFFDRALKVINGMCFANRLKWFVFAYWNILHTQSWCSRRQIILTSVTLSVDYGVTVPRE